MFVSVLGRFPLSSSSSSWLSWFTGQNQTIWLAAVCFWIIIHSTFLAIDVSGYHITTSYECCKVGQIYSKTDGCQMINISSASIESVSCRLEAMFCCHQATLDNACKRIGEEIVHGPVILSYLSSVIEQQQQPPKHQPSNAKPSGALERNHSVRLNDSDLWSMVKSRYQCQTRRNPDSLCCVGCLLGMTWAVKSVGQHLGVERVIETMSTTNASTLCQSHSRCKTGGVGHHGGEMNGGVRHLGFDWCCEETIRIINQTIKWCQIRPAPCAHRCHESSRFDVSTTNGDGQGVRCSCYEGYKLANDGKSCVDIDECEEWTHNCDQAHETCSNTDGGFQCLPKVDNSLRPMAIQSTGSSASPRSSSTIDQNECIKGYYYNKSLNRCKDIDECRSVDDNPCDLRYEVCRNLLGSFVCIRVDQECPSGFRRKTSANSTSTGCHDIDECLEASYDCDDLREDCENFIGSYTCEERIESIGRVSSPISSSSQLDASRNASISEPLTASTDPTRCQKGYHFVRFSFQCEDIDECRIGQHNCDLAHENCVNFPGSYSCIPIGGAVHPNFGKKNFYRTSAEQNRSSSEMVSKLVACLNGFERNELLNICEDVDECLNAHTACPENSYCQNTVGSFVCHCKAGFLKNQLDKCDDIDECARDLHHCLPTMRCINTLGSYECILQSIPNSINNNSSGSTILTTSQNNPKLLNWSKCSINQTYDQVLKTCIENSKSFEKNFFQSQISNSSYLASEPDTVVCGFGQRLVNGECTAVVCGVGFFYNATQNRCQDVNECLEYSPCRSNEKCTNTVGSFRCTRRCNPGYRTRTSSSDCEDIDECSSGSFTCPANQECKNRPGSYSCECKTGYVARRDGTCEDIDECQQGVSLCENPATQQCINTPGSYRCDCRAGYRTRRLTNGHIECIDIDECANSTLNQCQHLCYNYAGSFKCACQTGYRLADDGLACVDIDECQMFEHVEISEVSSIPSSYQNHSNELAENSKHQQYSLCYYKCINTPGSFECICPEGYESLSQGRICRDIDECKTESVCRGSNEYCLNVRGGYRCNVINCPKDYFLEVESKKCLRHLDGVMGFIDLNKPISYSFNYLSIVSNIRIPKALGYLDLVSMSGPVFSVTGIKFNLTLNAAKIGKSGVKRASRDDFILRRPMYNRIVVSLVRSLHGPQDVELELVVSLYQGDKFGGSSKAYIYIVVSEYDF